jgi:hypothetical protein
MRSKTAIVIVLLLQCIIVSQTLDHSVRRIAPRPTSRDISYITKLNDGRIVAAMNPTGLIYSSDDGLTWTEDLTLRTSNPPSNIVYLSEENLCGNIHKR